ncbi:ATPase, partial [Alkalihalophilus lindianensis]|nr:ATPase [Alkalihalophilus lindianensis]
ENRNDWNEAERLLVSIAALCNDSYINEDKQEIGDPTEIALINFANKHGQDYEVLRQKFPREAELPFDSDRKLMSTVHTIDGTRMLLAKGGP